MLLINGMLVFHIELKRSGVPVQEATNQIQKYAYEGVFIGLFALVQVFVAMNPTAHSLVWASSSVVASVVVSPRSAGCITAETMAPDSRSTTWIL